MNTGQVGHFLTSASFWIMTPKSCLAYSSFLSLSPSSPALSFLLMDLEIGPHDGINIITTTSWLSLAVQDISIEAVWGNLHICSLSSELNDEGHIKLNSTIRMTEGQCVKIPLKTKVIWTFQPLFSHRLFSTLSQLQPCSLQDCYHVKTSVCPICDITLKECTNKTA